MANRVQYIPKVFSKTILNCRKNLHKFLLFYKKVDKNLSKSEPNLSLVFQTPLGQSFRLVKNGIKNINFQVLLGHNYQLKLYLVYLYRFYDYIPNHIVWLLDDNQTNRNEFNMKENDSGKPENKRSGKKFELLDKKIAKPKIIPKKFPLKNVEQAKKIIRDQIGKYFEKEYLSDMESDPTIETENISNNFMNTVTPKQFMQAIDEATTNKYRSDVNARNEDFVAHLFKGIIHTDFIFPFPEILMHTHESAFVSYIKSLEEFFKNDPYLQIQNDIQQHYSENLLNIYRQFKLHMLNIPTEYGGLNLNRTQITRVMHTLGSYDLSSGVLINAHMSLACKPIEKYGTADQKKKIYKIIADGGFGAMALHEPDVLSDSYAIQSRAKLSPDGTFYTLNGTKSLVVNAPFASFFTVFALTNDRGHLEMSCFVFENMKYGIEISQPFDQMGIRAAQLCNVTFKNCKIPRDSLIEPSGSGYDIANCCRHYCRTSIIALLSDIFREVQRTSSSLQASTSGNPTGALRDVMKRTVEHTTMTTHRYTREFGAAQTMLTTMATNQYASEALSYMIAGNMDRYSKQAYYIDTAIAKCFVSEVTRRTVDDSMLIFGPRGYLKHSFIELMMRNILFFQFSGCSNIILSITIALSGIRHASVGMKSIQDEIKNSGTEFTSLFGSTNTNFKERMYRSSRTPTIMHLVHPDLQNVARIVKYTAAEFGLAINILLDSLGDELIRHQFFFLQIANATQQMYALLCVLSRCSAALYKGGPSAQHERMLTESFCVRTVTKVGKFIDLVESRGQKSLEKRNNKIIITQQLMNAGGCANIGVLGF